MKTGVIGIGAIGGTIARKVVAHGYTVQVANSQSRRSEGLCRRDSVQRPPMREMP